MSLTFQIIDWSILDDNDGEVSIFIFGTTKEGESVTLNVKSFEPFLYLKFDGDDNDVQIFYNQLCSQSNYIDKFINKENRIEKKKIFYGYSNDTINVLKLSFRSLICFYFARKFLKEKFYYNNKKFKPIIYEDKVSPILDFIHENNMKTCQWIRISMDNEKFPMAKTKYSYTVDKNDIELLDIHDIAPFYQMSYDIECYSHDHNKFPIPENQEDKIIQIGITFKRLNSNNIKQYLLTLGECDDIDNVNVLRYDNEKDLLLGFRDIINDEDPDIIYSYNGYRFDDNYMVTRSKILGIEKEFLTFSRLCEDEIYRNDNLCVHSKKNFDSSAYGTNDWSFINITGRINSDIYIYINRNFNLNSYKLDNVSSHFLTTTWKDVSVSLKENKIVFDKDINLIKDYNLIVKDVLDSYDIGIIIDNNRVTNEENYEIEGVFDIVMKINKHDVKPAQIFEYFASNDKENITKIAKYCIRDTLIPIMLSDKLNIFLNQIQMANVCYVPFSFLIDRGQQIKVFSQILNQTKKKGFIIPNTDTNNVSFEGACVLDPKRDAYFNPIIVLDFSSLYPSIIRAYNLCYSTIILDEKYDNLPGHEYHIIEWEEQGIKKRYKYVKNIPGILPGILTHLIEERKRVKRQMKIEKDEFKKMVLNGFQLALKISANSLYGFLSAQMLQCMQIGETVTAIGRSLITTSRDFINNNYEDFETIYGDSVTGDTVVTLKDNSGTIIRTRIDNIVDEYKVDDRGKEYGITDYSTWSMSGWNKIRRVIRHKKGKKKLFKITTFYGTFICTEDHSLIDDNGNIIKPEDIIIGKTKLLVNNP